MKVVFRVDASLLIGSGHVMRCMVLADELKRKGHNILFACTPLDGDLRSFISDSGFDVVTLPVPKHEVTPKHQSDYVSWLQKSVLEDVQDFISTVTSADLVITDHYAIGKEWQRIAINSLNCRLLALDDLARCHQADLILDQTLGRNKLDYHESNSQVLAGCEYALLKPKFANERESALSRTLTEGVPKILISMGGVDAPNATLKVLESLHWQIRAEFTVLLSPRAPHFKEVKAWCLNRSNVRHIAFVSDMAALMLKHDIAIGAPGTTSWERACLGLPNIIVPLADNQQMICEQLVKCKAAKKVAIDDIDKCMLQLYQSTLEQWGQYKSANLALCDGRGAKRVAFELEQLFVDASDKFCLTYASQEDIPLVYEWQSHPETRKYALNTSVPAWDEHKAWMSNKLQSATDYFYMVTNRTHGSKVGVVRLDRISEGQYIVSIFVEPNSYGKGIASKALLMLDAIHPDVTLHAKVLKVNFASQRLFKKARYHQVDEENYIRKPIN